MTEEAFLRYRMAVVERMTDSPSKTALIFAIQSRMEALRVVTRRATAWRTGLHGSSTGLYRSHIGNRCLAHLDPSIA